MNKKQENFHHQALFTFSLYSAIFQGVSAKGLGGGAAIYIRSNLDYTRLQQPSAILSAVCYSVWIKIATAKSKPIM